MGFGVSAVTTAELAQAFPRHEVVGLEREPDRVTQAQREYPELQLRCGDLDTLEPGSVLALRIANVARGLTRDEALALPDRIASVLVDRGVCLEGSTDEAGEVSSFFVWRRQAEVLTCEGLVFHTTGARGFGPMLMRDVLPRALRREVRPGSAIEQLLRDWERVWREVRTASALESFMASGEALAAARSDVECIGRAFVVWRQPVF